MRRFVQDQTGFDVYWGRSIWILRKESESRYRYTPFRSVLPYSVHKNVIRIYHRPRTQNRRRAADDDLRSLTKRRIAGPLHSVLAGIGIAFPILVDILGQLSNNLGTILAGSQYSYRVAFISDQFTGQSVFFQRLLDAVLGR